MERAGKTFYAAGRSPDTGSGGRAAVLPERMCVVLWKTDVSNHMGKDLGEASRCQLSECELGLTLRAPAENPPGDVDVKV